MGKPRQTHEKKKKKKKRKTQHQPRPKKEKPSEEPVVRRSLSGEFDVTEAIKTVLQGGT
jgi:hypothetical protein